MLCIRQFAAPSSRQFRHQHLISSPIGQLGIRNGMTVEHFLQTILSKLQFYPLRLIFFNMKIVSFSQNVSVWQTVSSQNPVISRHDIQFQFSSFPLAVAEIQGKVSSSVCHRNGPVLEIIPVPFFPGEDCKMGFLPALFQYCYKPHSIPIFNSSISRIQTCRDSQSSGDCHEKHLVGFLSGNSKLQCCTRSGVCSQALFVIAD